MSEVTTDDQAALEARALENAKTVEGWDVDKQRRYEEFMRLEREAAKAESGQRKATRDMALVASPPKPERVPDSWESVLCEIEQMPAVSGSLERAGGYIKVTSRFLLNKVLGISQEKVFKTHTQRLSRVMECLGWEKPPNIWIGTASAKGYRKQLEE